MMGHGPLAAIASPGADWGHFTWPAFCGCANPFHYFHVVCMLCWCHCGIVVWVQACVYVRFMSE